MAWSITEAAQSVRGAYGRDGLEPGLGEEQLRADAARATFTDFLRILSVAGQELEAAVFEQLWNALRAALAVELRRRGLWESPPSYLGVYGAERWGQAGTEAGPDPLDELTAECYGFIFVDRLRALEAQLGFRENVDGLVFLNIRHFLYERQKSQDPLGFQVFEALRTAVRRAVETGELKVLEGDPRVNNETIFGFRDGAETTDLREGDLLDLVHGWNDELLPDLVTAYGRARRPVLETLQRRLRDLPERGIEAIRFKDLLDPLKNDVRARWADLIEQEVREIDTDEAGGWAAGAEPLLRPDLRLQAQETFRALLACISDGVVRAEITETDRSHVSTLWGFLRYWVSGRSGEEGLPSGRKLATLLDIPRERLAEAYRVLRALTEECEQTLSSAARSPGERETE
jgi:hypothetical protein